MKTASFYRILVVDDEEEITESIAFFLSSKGLVCDRASDAMQALERFKSKTYDFVITDVVMPGMDGITLVRKLSREHPSLEIMVMSGLKKGIGHRTDQEAIEAGARLFISKPFSLTELWNQFQTLRSRPRIGQS